MASPSDSINEDWVQAQPTPGREKAVEEYFGSEGPRYEPILTRTFTHEGQKSDFARLASVLSKAEFPETLDDGQKGVERRDTLAGVELGDPVLNPSKPEFDFYKCVRMFVRLMEEDGIKHRRAGFTFKNLNVSGTGAALQLQSTVASLLMAPFRFRETFNLGHKPEKQILRNFNGTVKDGEMLIVLGKPGSGCTTFLKSVSGETRGLSVHKDSIIHYSGIPQHTYKKELRGDVAYNSEIDQHFPHLTVEQTLNFAAAARTPSTRVRGISRDTFSKHIAEVVMTIFGLIHIKNTKVGNDYVRGVSGGERKRVSIAEMALSGSPICCWDNSTRRLYAATALEFTQALRIASNVGGMTQGSHNCHDEIHLR